MKRNFLDEGTIAEKGLVRTNKFWEQGRGNREEGKEKRPNQLFLWYKA